MTQLALPRHPGGYGFKLSAFCTLIKREYCG